ncbi:MAG: polyphosphate polymerase domain-containing protein [Bacteroidota bacterium]
MRYERKYRIVGIPLPWVIQAVRMHPASFRTLYPQRQINNIYFDSPTLDEYYQNVGGVPQRRKHRLRWYGTQHKLLPSPTFEVKIKDGELGRKESQRLADTPWAGLRTAFQQLPHLQYLPLRPLLVNSYDRQYFGTGDQRFRITLDYNLRFGAFAWQHAPPADQLYTDEAVILELKYEAEDDERARSILKHLPFRQTKNSKYVTGIDLVFG